MESGILPIKVALLILHHFHQISDVAMENLAQAEHDGHGDEAVVVQLGHGIGRQMGRFGQLALFHFVLDQQDPKLIIFNGHGAPPMDARKDKCLQFYRVHSTTILRKSQ